MVSITKERVFHVTEILFQQMLAVFVLLIIWELFRQDYSISGKNTWHVILCVMGFALCMAEGVQIYRKESIVTFGQTRKDKVIAHLVVMSFAFVCMTIGIALKINEKEIGNRAHFASNHSKLGLASWIISFVVVIGGLIANYKRTGLGVSTRVIKLTHIFLGITAYALGITTLCLGMENYLFGSGKAWVVLVIVLVIYVVYSVIGPFISLYKYLFDK